MGRRGGYESGSMSASELLQLPEALLKPGAGMPLETAAEPVDAAPYVPTLRCSMCGHPDTTMRVCEGGYSLGWGMCTAEPQSHFHRGCGRCGCKWITYDTLEAVQDAAGSAMVQPDPAAVAQFVARSWFNAAKRDGSPQAVLAATALEKVLRAFNGEIGREALGITEVEDWPFGGRDA